MRLGWQRQILTCGRENKDRFFSLFFQPVGRMAETNSCQEDEDIFFFTCGKEGGGKFLPAAERAKTGTFIPVTRRVGTKSHLWPGGQRDRRFYRLGPLSWLSAGRMVPGTHSPNLSFPPRETAATQVLSCANTTQPLPHSFFLSPLFCAGTYLGSILSETGRRDCQVFSPVAPLRFRQR